MTKYLCIVQARLGSTRYPNKVMQTVFGVPMVRRVWLAAKMSWAEKVVVAWPERYPDLDENDVLGRYQRISLEFPSKYIIRLTADCPLISFRDINKAIMQIESKHIEHYNNRRDGFDVQIFPSEWLWNADFTNKEHVLNSVPNKGGMSVNTPEDLRRVRAYAQ